MRAYSFPGELPNEPPDLPAARPKDGQGFRHEEASLALPIAAKGLSLNPCQCLWGSFQGEHQTDSILLGSRASFTQLWSARCLLTIYAINMYRAAPTRQALCWALEYKETCKVWGTDASSVRTPTSSLRECAPFRVVLVGLSIMCPTPSCPAPVCT